MESSSDIKNILLDVRRAWEACGDPKARKCAEMMAETLEGSLAVITDGGGDACPPPVCPPTDLPGNSNRMLIGTLAKSWTGLRWTTPTLFKASPVGGAVREAHLLGPWGHFQSDRIAIKVVHVASNTTLPRHTQEASEVLQVVRGKDIRVGFLEGDWIEQKSVYSFPSTCPKVVKTTEEDALLISARIGKVNGEAWFNDVHKDATDKYINVTILDHSNVEQFYDGMAEDYEKTVKSWGYCIPEIMSDAIENHGKLASRNSKILDLGCGDGAVGRALYDRGFRSIYGVDISGAMLSMAAERGCYVDLKKANLLQPLPFEDDSFDCLLTAGVTTYLEPYAIEHWLKVVKPGGILCVEHKNGAWSLWEEQQEKLERDDRWRKVWINSDPIPYLPVLNSEGANWAKIYIYQKM